MVCLSLRGWSVARPDDALKERFSWFPDRIPKVQRNVDHIFKFGSSLPKVVRKFGVFPEKDARDSDRSRQRAFERVVG